MNINIIPLSTATSANFPLTLKATAFQDIAWLNETPQAKDVYLAEINSSFVIPYYIDSWHGIKVLRIAGGKAGDYQDFWYLTPKVVPNYEELSEALKEIAKKTPFDIFFAERCPSSISLPSFPFWESSHQLKLDSDFEQIYAKKIPIKIRNDSSRQMRRLKELGELHFLVAQDVEEAQLWLNTTIVFKEEHYRRLQVPSIFADARYLKFYHSITEKHWNSKALRIHVSALKLNEQIISTHWGIVFQNRFYYMFPAYQNEFAKYSPGRIHLLNLIQWATQNKIEIFDFTIGDEGYKNEWCDEETKLYQVFYILSWKGYFFLAKEKLRRFLKKSNQINSSVLKTLFYLERQK